MPNWFLFSHCQKRILWAKFFCFEMSSSLKPLTLGCSHGQGHHSDDSKAANGENENERAWRGPPVFISVTPSQTQQEKAWKIQLGGRKLELLEAQENASTTVRRQTPSIARTERWHPSRLLERGHVVERMVQLLADGFALELLSV